MRATVEIRLFDDDGIEHVRRHVVPEEFVGAVPTPVHEALRIGLDLCIASVNETMTVKPGDKAFKNAAALTTPMMSERGIESRKMASSLAALLRPEIQKMLHDRTLTVPEVVR